MMQVYGECIGASASAAAMISQLGAGGCELLLENASALLDSAGDFFSKLKPSEP